MVTPNQLEQQAQDLRERLKSADETNGQDRRIANRAHLRKFEQKWKLLSSMEGELEDGPSGLQLAVMLDDLTPCWEALRKRARRQTPYVSDTGS